MRSTTRSWLGRAVWFSHGHPDHLNPSSLPLFRDTRILVPDHVGGRIATDLRRDGYRVEVMPDRVWVPLSDRVRALCITDAGQDAVLLVDVDGRLVVNVNDAQDRGWGSLVKRVIREFHRSFLLRLSGFGDADMANFFDEDGHRVPSLAQLRKEAGFSVGADIARMAETFGVSHFVPFSSFHRYQRADSVWANDDHGRLCPTTSMGSRPIASTCCRRSCSTTARPTRGIRFDRPRRPRSRGRLPTSVTTGARSSTPPMSWPSRVTSVPSNRWLAISTR